MSNLVSARVTLTLEIPAKSCWGPNCTMDQIVKQAKEDIHGMLRNSKEPMMFGSKIIGTPKVTAILAIEE